MKLAMDTILQRLCDESEIRQLVHIWMDGIDTKSYDRLRSTWADEMETDFSGFPDMGGGPILSGKHPADDRRRGVIRMVSEFSATQQVVSNHVITVEGDHATCNCYVVATQHLASPDCEPCSVVGARYELEAVRLPMGWRLSRFKWTSSGHRETTAFGPWLASASPRARRPTARSARSGRAAQPRGSHAPGPRRPALLTR